MTQKMHKILYASKNSEKTGFFSETLPTLYDTFKYLKYTDAKNHSVPFRSLLQHCPSHAVIFGASPSMGTHRCTGHCRFGVYVILKPLDHLRDGFLLV